jgi:hypothetical protein
MKINPNVNNLALNETKAKQDKKEKIHGEAPAKPSSMVNIGQKNTILNSHNISREESENIMGALKESFNNISVNIESLFSGISSEKTLALLKETN